jgi:hypothetical protein
MSSVPSLCRYGTLSVANNYLIGCHQLENLHKCPIDEMGETKSCNEFSTCPTSYSPWHKEEVKEKTKKRKESIIGSTIYGQKLNKTTCPEDRKKLINTKIEELKRKHQEDALSQRIMEFENKSKFYPHSVPQTIPQINLSPQEDNDDSKILALENQLLQAKLEKVIRSLTNNIGLFELVRRLEFMSQNLPLPSDSNLLL